MNNNEFNAFLSGQNIYLREITISDVPGAYYRWMNDPAITQFLESRFYPNTMDSLNEYVKNKQADSNNVFLAIVIKENHRHIGNIKLGPINWIHRFADIGIIIGEKDCWGKGYASEAISLVTKFAFNTLNLHKLTAGCYEMNQGSVKAFQKAGFYIEGGRKSQYYYQGAYIDGVKLAILKD
jgi:[ribosomal protein S5]-alanine N-acetyltransferase